LTASRQRISSAIAIDRPNNVASAEPHSRGLCFGQLCASRCAVMPQNAAISVADTEIKAKRVEASYVTRREERANLKGVRVPLQERGPSETLERANVGS